MYLSVLGPVHFNLLIYNLDEGGKAHPQQDADDIKLEEVFDAPDGFAVHPSWTSLL